MQHISWNIVTLPNGKYYGEMVWQNKKDLMHVDEAAVDGKGLMRKMLPGVKVMLRTRIFNYLSWRKNSFGMRGIDPFPETKKAMDRMYGLTTAIQYAESVAEVARLVCECEKAIKQTKPGGENHLWNDMELMLTWAQAVYVYRSTQVHAAQKETPAVRS